MFISIISCSLLLRFQCLLSKVVREKAGPKNPKTWAICFPGLKDPLGKPLFPTQNAARMFASRWGISTEMLHWTPEEVDFLYKTQHFPVRVVKRKLHDEFEKDVTLEQVRYKRKKIKERTLSNTANCNLSLAGENAGSLSVAPPSAPASAGENAGSSSVSLPPRSPALMHSGLPV
jgi:hypothetical protein